MITIAPFNSHRRPFIFTVTVLNWGYYPSGGVGVILTVVIVLLLLGRI
jgi:hypothetical protein